MHSSNVKILLFLVLAIFPTGISSATRNRRQIIFEEDDNNNRVSKADCRTPDRQPGRCLRLTSCPALRATTSMNRLRRYFCGFEGQEPKVCCPQGTVGVVRPPATTRRTTPSTRGTTRTTRRMISTTRPTLGDRNVMPTRRTTTRPVSLPNTRSLVKPRFLPDECGEILRTKSRVVGGREAEKNGWPWMAVVFIHKRNGRKTPECGGSLVTNRHVVTAAHCVVVGRGSNTMDPSQVSVRLGAHDLRIENEPGAMDIGVEAIRRHEAFDPRTYRNDIAVLKLSRPIQFTKKISPVCLPYDSLRNDDLAGNTAYVTGFGTTSFNGESSDVLLEANFDIQSQELCKKAYEKELNITRVYMCAGTDTGSKDSCQGDSGGPLVTVGNSTGFYLVGVVSFGKLCGQPGYPGVYTRVTEFLDWLAKNLAD